jgi:hypothetical protein
MSVPRQIRVVFFTFCATVVSVGIWIITFLLNLIHWLFGEAAFVHPLSWSIVILSSAVFWVVFYRHFSKTESK